MLQQTPAQPEAAPVVQPSAEQLLLQQMEQHLKGINNKLGFFVFLAIVTILINILF